MAKFVKIFFVLATLLLLLALGLIANPFNWFTHKSARFSRERFVLVQSGMREQDLVRLLGEPLRVIEHTIPDPECKRCVSYYFMGDAPGWLPGFQEAWVYVDGDGVVKGKVWNVEP
jgi:hypothetical protein